MYLPLFVGVLCSSLFWYGLLYFLSSLAITMYLDEEEKAGSFAFIVFWMSCHCKCPVALTHGAVGGSGVCDCRIP